MVAWFTCFNVRFIFLLPYEKVGDAVTVVCRSPSAGFSAAGWAEINAYYKPLNGFFAAGNAARRLRFFTLAGAAPRLRPPRYVRRQVK